MSFQFGIDRLLSDEALNIQLSDQRIALIAHPASITNNNLHSVDALISTGFNVVKAFGPQHGMRGDVQDNMIETDDYLDPTHKIPVVSLYGEHRKPTDDMLQDVDVVLFDLQDVGCRIYTYITTLHYFVECCARLGKPLWILDRPNPAGRPIDGLFLESGQESFVGCAEIPTRHGLTTGELAQFFSAEFKFEQLNVVQMTNYEPNSRSGFGWPLTRPWVNPSPNASSANMARCFPGTVLLEGTELSEGRGTTTPLEVLGAPGLPINDMLQLLASETDWSQHAIIRSCFFMPTFHKYTNELCEGIQIHTDVAAYNHESFKPYRLIAGLLKALRICDPDYQIWRHHDYEYELDRIPIDVINGGAALRNWVDNPDQDFAHLSEILSEHESRWANDRSPFLIYQ